MTVSRSDPSFGGGVGGWAVSADEVVVGVDAPVVLDPGDVVLVPEVAVADGEELDGFDGSDPVVVEPSAEGSTTRADDGAAEPGDAVVGIGQVVELVPASTVASEPASVSSGELQAAASSDTAARPTAARCISTRLDR